MENTVFEELAASVREGGAIVRGEAKPARSFEIEVDESWRLEVAPTKTQSRPAPTESL